MMPSKLLVISGSRTPITRRGGALAGWHPVDLTALVMNQLAPQGSGCEELWVGCAEPVGAQGANMARAAVHCAGWPATVTGAVVDQSESSGMAALGVASGRAVTTAGLVMAAGVGMSSTVPPGSAAMGRTYGKVWGDGSAARVGDGGGLLPAPRLAEKVARAMGIGRVELDRELARQFELAAPDDRDGSVAGRLAIPAAPGEAAPRVRARDLITGDDVEDRRSADVPAPMFDPDGLLSASDVAGPSDGVAAVLLASAGVVDDRGLKAIGELLAHVSVGGPLDDPLGGVERAVATALARADLSMDRVGRIAVRVSTSAAVVLVRRRLELTDDDPRVMARNLVVGDAGAASEVAAVVDGLHSDIGYTLTVTAAPGGAAAAVWTRLSV